MKILDDGKEVGEMWAYVYRNGISVHINNLN